MARFNGWRLTRAGLIFIVVAILLAVTVFGVIRFVQQRGEQARQDEATQIALQNQDEQSETPVIAEDAPAGEGSGAATTESSTGTAPGNSAATTEEGAAAGAPSNGSSTNAAIPQTGTTQLPATGIGNILPIILLALAAFGAAHVIQNKRSQA